MKGFSIIEIIAVLGISLVLVAIVIFSFSSFQKSQNLDLSIEEALSAIHLAYSKTLSSEDFSQHGVHFESSKIVFFKGNTYSAIDPNNIESNLSLQVEISNISLNGGGSDLVFEKNTGKTDNYGTITFQIKGTSDTKIISIKNTGIVNVL